ncbi:succinylglutamate desuccinylase/aspartoacylase family protein [Raoultella ornithinolytica]|uniref:succinylglutamate desuccinylase/aspartoacylase family protein n=1 Tax=Raoultella ornithinolytica TaxID=54291 RepID=UPI00096A91E1|nr:succinylglutamate desuccinylase/aspartoacylase family protein [Raoultella ornithinolytica]MCT8167878.1 succinylglutamate desuccinylase/aspartoacylase family protein [Raoultella ornithinolytica]MEB7943458.1 M14 family metallopeptidase [Raoultella ornithinolytica]
MKIKHYTLPEHALSGQRQLTHFHFGEPGRGEKIYLQAGLHADEIPGMLVLHYLKRLLNQAERRAELRGEIILVPVANPPGLAQVVLNGGIGRFDLASGRNFNRDFPDLAPLAQRYLCADEPLTREAYLQQVREAMREALAAEPLRSEVQALRHHLLSLACDADVVLDLHCDDRAILHLYADPAWQAEAGVVAAFLGIETVLLSQESGGYSFDEACGLPWHRLAARFPQWQHGQPGCMAVTVELRGQQDVNHALAREDAERLYRYLQYRGVLAGACPPVPQQETLMLPFSGGEIVTAPASGILVPLKQPGEWVSADEVVAEIIDPLTDMIQSVRPQVGGLIYACRRAPFVTFGAEVMKIVGKQPYAGGGGLAM